MSSTSYKKPQKLMEKSRVVLETRYKYARKKLMEQIEKVKASAYEKDVQRTITYYVDRVPTISKLKTKRDLAFAIAEAEYALEHKTFSISRLRTKRKSELSSLQERFGSDKFKSYKDVRKFYSFMENVRNRSEGIKYDSGQIAEFFEQNSDLTGQELLDKYDEYSARVQKRRGKRSKHYETF